MPSEEMTKPCRECGKLIVRHSREGKRRFEKRRYCSFSCSNLGRSKHGAKQPPIVPHDQGYEDTSHGDKTAIAYESAAIAHNEARRDKSLEHAIGDHIAAIGPTRANEGPAERVASDNAEGASTSAPGVNDNRQTSP